jgi:hypothetical protein
MDRDVRVNAEYLGDYPQGADEGADVVPAAFASGADYGPCLYLGPSGERCSRRALGGGFCAPHQPGAQRLVASKPAAKRMAAVVGALVALLPWLGDLIRELIRLLR